MESRSSHTTGHIDVNNTARLNEAILFYAPWTVQLRELRIYKALVKALQTAWFLTSQFMQQ